MHNNLFDYVNINPERTHLPNGMEPDSEKECSRYEALIQSLGGVDLQLLGLGHNGHIGLMSRRRHSRTVTHCVDLQQRTIEANKRFFDSIDDVPKQAYTMGIKTIMMAKKILIVVSGEDKAEIVKGSVFRPCNTSGSGVDSSDASGRDAGGRRGGTVRNAGLIKADT